jgi:hypothetical protein
MPETNLRSKDGYRFTAAIGGHDVEGEIAVYDGAVYLLQNKSDGSHGGSLRGYNYSWTVGSGSESDLEGHGVSKMKVGSNKIDKNSSHSSFKVGQRVQFKSSLYEFKLMGLAGLAPGRSGTITCVNSAGMNVRFDTSGRVEAVYCDDMEPITLETKKAGTFNKGDRVKVKDSVTSFIHGGATALKSRFGTVVEPPIGTSSIGILFDDDHNYRMDTTEMEHTTVQKGNSATTTPTSRPCHFKVGDQVRVKADVASFKYGGTTSTGYSTAVVIETRKWNPAKGDYEIVVKWDLDDHKYAMGDDEMEFSVPSPYSSLSYRDGQTFSAKIKGEYAEGKISINERVTSRTDDKIFLCQNVRKGSKAPDLKGYDYSWSIRWGMPEDLRRGNIEVTDLKLDVTLSGAPIASLTEPKFKKGDKVKVKPEHARSITFGDFDEAHTGCVVASWKFDEDKGHWAYKTEYGWNFIEYQFELITAASGPKPPEPRFKKGDILRPKDADRTTAYGGNGSYFVDCTVDQIEWDSVKHDWKYRVVTKISGSGLWIKESEFELSKPKVALPKFKVGDVIRAKVLGRLSYGGNPAEFQSATVIASEGYPIWREDRKAYDYRVKTASATGFIIWENDFELAPTVSATKSAPSSLPKFRVGEILYPKSSVKWISYGGDAEDFYGCIVESAPTWVDERSDWKYRVSTKNGSKGLCITEKEFESHAHRYVEPLTAAVFDELLSDLSSYGAKTDTGWIDPKITKEPDLTFKTGPKKFSL